jgi:hypothetical protein
MGEGHMAQPHDIPFDDAVKQALELVEQGVVLHQKFTCSHCGSRQTMERPNAFFEQGICEECNEITNIKAQGCGFAALIGAR